MSSVIKPYRLPTQTAWAPQTSPTPPALNTSARRKNTKYKFQVIPEALLASLSLPTDAIPPSHARKPERDTCTWIFRHPIFRTWQKERYGLLWIRGSSGSGKSTLMKHLASQPTEPASAGPKNSNTVHVSFFFRATGDGLYRSRLGFARSILCQLIRRFPAVFDRLKQRFEQIQCLLPVGLHVLWDVQELLDEIARSLPIILKTNSVRFVIDGIDLCGEEIAKQLLQDLQKLVEKTSVISTKMNNYNSFKVIVSSGLIKAQELLPLKIIAMNEQNRADIEKFIRRRLANADTQTQDFTIYQSAGSFLVAQLLTQSFKLSGDPSIWRRQQSQNFLSGDPFDLLRKRFHAMAQRKGHKLFLSLLTWACFSVRPLTLSEFRIVVCTSAATSFPSIQWPFQADEFSLTCSDDDFEAWISTQSGALLEVAEYQGKKTIQPVHELVREFIVSEGLELLAPGSTFAYTTEESVVQIHYSLVRFCVQYIAFTTQEAGWGAEVSKRLEFQLLSYAGLAWTKHAVLSRVKAKNAAELLELLNWPDKSALAIFGKVTTRKDVHLKPEQSACPYGKLDGINWLHLLAMYGLDDLLKAALRNASIEEIDSRDSLGRTPLYAAVCCGHATAAKILLEKGADVTLVVDGQSLLHIAALQGHIMVQKLLLAQSPELVFSINATCQTPLFSAVLREHVSSVILLLNNHSEVNSYDGSGTPILLRAAALGSLPVVHALLDSGALIDQQDQGGFTALHAAVAKAHNPVVHLLLDKGCTVDIKDKLDRTPLLLSVLRANEGAVKYLLEKRAEASITDDKGRALLLIAIEKGSVAVTKLLLDIGFNVNLKDSTGRTMLMIAVSKLERKLVKLLLEYKASITARDRSGNSVIFYATKVSQDGQALSKEQKAICTVLFDKYSETVVTWDPDWKQSQALFLACSDSQVRAKKAFGEIQAYIPKDGPNGIPFFSSQPKPAGDELMFGGANQKTTPQKRQIPASLQPARIETEGLASPVAIPSFLLPGGSADSRRLSLQEPQRSTSSRSSPATPQHGRSISETTVVNFSQEPGPSFKFPSSTNQHGTSTSGPSTRKGTPEPHPLQRPGANLLGQPYAKPCSLPSSLKSSPLIKPYDEKALSNLREIDHFSIAAKDKTGSRQGLHNNQQLNAHSNKAGIPSALKPGSTILNPDSTKPAPYSAPTHTIKPYPGSTPPRGFPFSTPPKPVAATNFGKPPTIPPLNQGLGQYLGAGTQGGQGSQTTTISEDWFSKFAQETSGTTQKKGKSPAPAHPVAKAFQVPTALQPGGYAGSHATETSTKAPKANSEVKRAAIAGGAGAAAGLAGGHLLRSEFLSSTSGHEHHQTILHDEFMASREEHIDYRYLDSGNRAGGSNFKHESSREVGHESKPLQEGRIYPGDYSTAHSAQLLRTEDTNSDHWLSDGEEGYQGLSDNDADHGHQLVDYSPADYGGHWGGPDDGSDDEYTSQVSSSVDEGEYAGRSSTYYDFEYEHYKGPLNEDDKGSEHGSNSTEKGLGSYKEAQYSYHGGRFATRYNAGNEGVNYEGAQYSYSNKSYGAKYQVEEESDAKVAGFARDQWNRV